MNCKNCGTPLMGMEHACPVCGAPLPTTPPQPGAVPPMAPGQVMPEQLASQPPQMMPGGSAPAGLPVEQAPAPEPKKGNNVFAILLLLVAFAAIGVGVFLAFTDEEEEPAKKNSPEEAETTPSDNEASNTVSYAGYMFTMPEGYSGTVNGTHGLIIRGADKVYSVLIDYTKDYAYYKQEFQLQQKAPTEVVNVESAEFVICTLTDENGGQAVEYMTSAGATSTFAGLVVKADYTPATVEDLTTIYNVLSTATLQTEIAPGSEEDAGKTEIVNYIPRFKKDEWVF